MHSSLDWQEQARQVPMSVSTRAVNKHRLIVDTRSHIRHLDYIHESYLLEWVVGVADCYEVGYIVEFLQIDSPIVAPTQVEVKAFPLDHSGMDLYKHLSAVSIHMETDNALWLSAHDDSKVKVNLQLYLINIKLT